MKKKWFLFSCTVVMTAVLVGPGVVFGQSQAKEAVAAAQSEPRPPFIPPVSAPGAPGSEKQVPAIKKVGPGVFEVGGCRLSKAEGWVRFEAAVNMNQGLLEYLIVGEAGKLHESLLRTAVDPYALQIAFLLVGMEGTAQPLSAQGERRVPSGDRVTVHVRRLDETGSREVPIEHWVRLKDKPLENVPWVFTGSVIAGGVFMAGVEKSIMALYHDPVALIDHILDEGADDEVWFANEKAVPPVGTPVEVVVARVGSR